MRVVNNLRYRSTGLSRRHLFGRTARQILSILQHPTGIRPTGAFVNGHFNFSYSFFASMSSRQIGISIFPQRKEILIGLARFRCIVAQHSGTRQAKVRERIQR